MKSTLLRTFFEWALITSVLMSGGFFVWYYVTSHAARANGVRLVNTQMTLQNYRSVIGVLRSEYRDYAKTNADLARLLESVRSQPAAAPVAPAAATKPKAK